MRIDTIMITNNAIQLGWEVDMADANYRVTRIELQHLDSAQSAQLVVFVVDDDNHAKDGAYSAAYDANTPLDDQIATLMGNNGLDAASLLRP